MALVVPQNSFAVPVPQNPAMPATLADITNAAIYCDRLLRAKSESIRTPAR
jgi:hypothetical protein